MTSVSEQKVAVKFDDVCYSYGSGKRAVIALKNINIQVFKGNIFALLGASGSGKTTFVNLCVGWKKPKSGRVTVFGEEPGTIKCGIPGTNIGFMPQELSLYPDFTIDETFSFFGHLYGLSKKEIICRNNELTKFLKLPNGSRLVLSLSGGQQRRVSFAVALMHRPRLTVTDEPTVGLDPVLRKSIWEYLLCLTKDEHFTAIITTHHIEEAKFADYVCFLRDGETLLTENPEILMQKFCTPSLDDIFLKICMLDKNENGISQNQVKPFIHYTCNEINFEEKEKQPLNSFALYDENPTECVSVVYPSSDIGSKTKSSKLGRITAMSTKNVIRLKHNISVIIFQLLTPTLCIILFCTCFGRDPQNVAIGVNNFDELKLSKWFLQAIDNTTVYQINFTSLDNAMKSLKNGEIWALIQIGPGFSKAIENRFYYKQNVDEATFEKSKIKVHIDWTNQIIGAHIQKTIFDAIVNFGIKCSAAYGEKYSSQTIVDIQKPIYADRRPSLTEFSTPGNIVIFVFFSAAASTSLVFVLERKEGTFKRCIVAGVHPHEFLISHLLQQILILIIQISIMLSFTFFVFHIANRGSYITIFVLVFLQGFCGVSYGLFVSAISQQENHAFTILMGSLLPNFLISGFIWPLETMPYFIMQIGKWFPNAAAIDALRYVMYRGWTLTNNLSISIGFFVTITWSIAFLTIALIIFRRSYFT